MKPEDVRFHHIRDWPWPLKRCPKCGRAVPWFHKHIGRVDFFAAPLIEAERGRP